MIGIDFNIDNWNFLGSDVINYIKSHLVMVLVIAGFLLIIIYSLIAVFLNKLNKAMYGKTTWMAWFPVLNIYLLGKLTIHRIFGFFLMISSFLGISYSTNINGIEEVHSILPKNIQKPFMIGYGILILILYVYAHFKLMVERKKTQSREYDEYNPNTKPSAYDLKYNKRSSESVVNRPVIEPSEHQIDEPQEPIIAKPTISLQSISYKHDDNTQNNNPVQSNSSQNIDQNNNQNP